MNGPIYSMCVVNKIRNTPRASPKQIYQYYHKTIQAKQQKEIQNLEFPLKLIDEAIRNLNVATDDPTENAYIRKTTDMLQSMDKEIRDNVAKPDAVFLTALDTVFKHTC